jgi:hypothetical protein
MPGKGGKNEYFVFIPEPARSLKVVIFCEIRDYLSGAKSGQAVSSGSAGLLAKNRIPLGIRCYGLFFGMVILLKRDISK